jgi:hypothetical protein
LRIRHQDAEEDKDMNDVNDTIATLEPVWNPFGEEEEKTIDNAIISEIWCSRNTIR